MTDGYKTVSIPEDCWESLKILSIERRESLQDTHEFVLRKALKLPKDKDGKE